MFYTTSAFFVFWIKSTTLLVLSLFFCYENYDTHVDFCFVSLLRKRHRTGGVEPCLYTLSMLLSFVLSCFLRSIEKKPERWYWTLIVNFVRCVIAWMFIIWHIKLGEVEPCPLIVSMNVIDIRLMFSTGTSSPGMKHLKKNPKADTARIVKIVSCVIAWMFIGANLCNVIARMFTRCEFFVL